MEPRLHESWQDVVPGIIVLATLILLAVGIFFVDTLRREFLEGPTVILLADDIRGLTPGADVWVAGKPAGRVKSISFIGSGSSEPGRVALQVILLREAVPSLRADATAQIGQSSLLAPPVVKFRPGSPEAPPFNFADTLTVTPVPGIETFRALADSGRVAMALLSEDLARLESELATGDGTLPQLRRHPEVAGQLTAIGQRAELLRESWARSGGFRQLARDSVSLARMARLSESMNTLSGQASARASEFEPILQALQELRARNERLDASLRAARGTAGRLLYDGELQLQTERTRALSDSLQAELAADPLRWLRFRLF
jgi:ABC-type transporter Mla subunit MlaD